MSEVTRQEINEMVARITTIERVSDVQEEKISSIENNAETLYNSIQEFQKTLQSQGIKLAIIFGSISVIVTGIGVIVGVVTLLQSISGVLRP